MDAQHRRQQVGRLLFALLPLALGACGSKTEAAHAAHHHPQTHAPNSAGGRVVEVLPFIHDDYPKALAEAKRRNKPLFVDAWAPWCHSCQSLRTYVLTDPSLASLAPDFVWLSVDTEKDVNGEWVTRHPHEALPTLWVIDPKTDQPILKWAGTATAEELRALLTVSVMPSSSSSDQKQNQNGKSDGAANVEATAAFVRGNHALAAGDPDTAEREHRAALEAAPRGHPHRARIVEALVTLLSLRKQHGPCAEVAAAHAADLPLGTSRASVLVAGLSCAREVKPKRLPEIDVLLALAIQDARARDAITTGSSSGVPAAKLTLLPDDRSALYEEIFETRQAAGDLPAARAIAEEWVKFLEAESARVKDNSDARTSLDPLLLSAYLALKEPGRAVPMLQQSERDFPNDYNPPARLGRAYLEMNRLDDADKAADRAIARVYGPRAMRVFGLKADIAKARGNRTSEIAALEEALARSDKSVLTEGQKSVRDGLRKRLAALR